MDKKMEQIFEDLESDIVEKMNQLSLKHEKVGFVFDERMLTHKDSYPHVERPERAMSIYMNLVLKGLADKLVRLPSEEISDEDLLRIHTEEHVAKITDFQYEDDKKTPRKKGESKSRYSDIYDNVFTSDAARVSAGSLMSCCKSVVNGKVDSAFAIIRPPGHHANSKECRGFCFYNNVGVIAHYLVNDCMKKVAIVDWDVHHGDGTQELFYKDQNPLFLSLHRYDNKLFYPGTGHHEEIGEGQGKGFNINIPWNTHSFTKGNYSIGDAEYIYAFETIVLPVLTEYKPDIIIVSCGFDAAENDPLGKLSLSPVGYAYMTYQLKRICNKMIVALEGGYNVDSLARCSESIIRTLMNEPVGFKDVLLQKYVSDLDLNVLTLSSNLLAPSFYTIDQVNKVKEYLESFWTGLKNVKTLTPSRKILRKDDSALLSQLADILGDSEKKNKYLMTSEDSEKIQITQPDFFKFRIGSKTLPDIMKKSHLHKYKRRTIIDNKTLTKDLKFRLEGIFLDIHAHKAAFNEKHFNWAKRDGIFDTSENDLSYLISKFLVQTKISKSDLITEIEKLSQTYEKLFAEKGLDLYNVDLVVLPLAESIEKENEKDTANKRKTRKKKNEVKLKLNGVKAYSLVKTKNLDDTHDNNFLTGLRSLITFLQDNLMD